MVLIFFFLVIQMHWMYFSKCWMIRGCGEVPSLAYFVKNRYTVTIHHSDLLLTACCIIWSENYKQLYNIWNVIQLFFFSYKKCSGRVSATIILKRKFFRGGYLWESHDSIRFRFVSQFDNNQTHNLDSVNRRVTLGSYTSELCAKPWQHN